MRKIPGYKAWYFLYYAKDLHIKNITIKKGVFIMKITINATTKNTQVTDAIREKIENKLSKLDKFLPENADIRVVTRVVKQDQIIEITVPNYHGKMVRVEERDASLYNAIDNAERILSRKLRKIKEKDITKHRTEKPDPYIEEVDKEEAYEEKDIEILREKELFIDDMEPMSDSDAAAQMMLLGHSFYVYRNRSKEICVVYRRARGGCGMIKIVH